MNRLMRLFRPTATRTEPRRRRRSAPLACESLEGRQLLSAFARSFSAGPANDIAVFRPSNGTWYVEKAGTGFTTSWSVQWGTKGDIPIQKSDFFGDGDAVSVSAEAELLRFLLISGKPIREPVAWHGPIVMNTQQELRVAFKELEQGTFIKHRTVER